MDPMAKMMLVAAGAAIIPLLIGAIWYNPKIGFGNAWMRTAGLTEAQLQGANMAVIFGLTYLLSFFVAMALNGIVIHQLSVFSILQAEPGFLTDATAESTIFYNNFMDTYGDRFRWFGHGALHGAMAGFFLALPILGINAMFERKGFKYIAINVGFWVVSLALMGGVICQWA